MRLLFQGGSVVTGQGVRRADILVEGEKILDVCRDIPPIGAQVVDVSGMLLFPGFIDAHTHFDLDVCNTTTADDFASGSRAALHGGTTTIIADPHEITNVCGKAGADYISKASENIPELTENIFH